MYELVKDNRSVRNNQNLIEALTIQVPKKIGEYFFEVVPTISKYHIVAEVFLKSLIWRKPATINEKAGEYADTVIAKDE